MEAIAGSPWGLGRRLTDTVCISCIGRELC